MKFQQENQPQPQEIIQMDNEETELNPKSFKNIRHLQAIVDSIVIIVIYCISYLIENYTFFDNFIIRFISLFIWRQNRMDRLYTNNFFSKFT